VDPNLVTDSQAYSTAPLVVNPNGQPGVTAVYNHRNGGMQITNTILILPDAAGVSAALGGLDAAAKVAGGQTQPAAVGTGGTMVSGMSPDGSKSVTVVTFTRGNAAAMLEFDGPPKDPAPADLVTELGQKQDTAIRIGRPPRGVSTLERQIASMTFGGHEPPGGHRSHTPVSRVCGDGECASVVATKMRCVGDPLGSDAR